MRPSVAVLPDQKETKKSRAKAILNVNHTKGDCEVFKETSYQQV